MDRRPRHTSACAPHAHSSCGHHRALDDTHSLLQAVQANLPVHKVTMGLPFYGRYAGGAKNGDWVTYEVRGV